MQWHNAAQNILQSNDPAEGYFGEAADAMREGWAQVGLDFRPPIQLATLKDRKKEEIKAARNAAEAAGFDYNGGRFDSDAISCQRITAAASVASMALATNQPFAITWTLQDNATMALDAAGMCGVLQALATYSAGLHAKAGQLKAEVDAAATAEEVAAIVW